MPRAKATKIGTFKIKPTKKRKPKLTKEQIDKMFRDLDRIAYGR